ncbi:MAG: SDR family oxidoreductase [Phaeodactylibacter sp.]|nr:SDR family oxidoreductase [Phaeodactylibacter sp.]MCB9266400.1 SDR family oxidoreductase [Lewinellaceae bacterium]MCB9291181.1 SDR family oxidoreductase [Lewinellaceae bacterium]
MKHPVALITGAASGIGRHFALSNRERFRWVVTDVEEARLKDVFGNETETFLPLSLNVSNAQDWRSAITAALTKFGRIDYLFNIAGVSLPRFITDADESIVEKHLDINAKGVLYGTTFAAQEMEKRGGGHIINIASLAGIAPVPGMAYYTASKFAVRGFSLAAALELREKNIYVTVICPDLVRTPMLDHQLTLPRESALSFSGSTRVLAVEDVEKAILKAIRKKPLELALPLSRGILAKIGGSISGLAWLLYRRLYRKGLRNAGKLKNEYKNLIEG